MGKGEQSLSAHAAAAAPTEEDGESTEGNAGAGCRQCRWIGRAVRVRCVVALVLGVAVLLSAVFWLTGSLRDGTGPGELDSQVETNIVATFQLPRPRSELSINVAELQYDVFEEIGVANSSNLYVSLTNARGSTVSPPTIIQTSILLSVGNHPPSQLRLKELAQAITPARNLGLNNTVFGRVKQISLSSFLQHSINGVGVPSSAPQPHPSHHHHRHHHHQHHRQFQHHHQHHHHQHHNPDMHFAPTPTPAPQNNNVFPPPGCKDGYPQKSKNRYRFDTIAPSITSHHYSMPDFQGKSPAPASVTHPDSSSIPNVLFMEVEPSSEIRNHAEPPDKVSSSCTTSCHHFIRWALALLFYLFTCL